MGYETFIVQYKNGSGDWVQVEKSDTDKKKEAVYLARKLGNARVVQISYHMGKETRVLIEHKSRQMEMV